MYYLTKIYSIACKVKKKNLDYKILAPLFVHKCDRRGAAQLRADYFLMVGSINSLWQILDLFSRINVS